MALNLVRNSRLFFTTNVNTAGVVQAAGHDNTKTFEIQVLDGFSFSQNTNTETVTVNEAGSSPVRGQRTFNTSLAPVDFSFSTYVRPIKGTATNVLCEESVLWGALTSVTGNGWVPGASASTATLANSNSNKLQTFGLVMVIDSVTYAIDNCVLNQASVDFGIDAIATIAWSGNGGTLRRLTGNVSTTAAGSFDGGGPLTGTYYQKITSAGYLANKLSTGSLISGSSTYSVALTGGNLTFNNNVTYLTPANLGTVNTPITYFTGTRAISGSLNAYLKTGGANDMGELLNTMLINTSDVSPNYGIYVQIGGSANPTKVELRMPTSSITIPSVDVQQVVSTTINFTAQSSSAGTQGSGFNIENANELTVVYVAP